MNSEDKEALECILDRSSRREIIAALDEIKAQRDKEEEDDNLVAAPTRCWE